MSCEISERDSLKVLPRGGDTVIVVFTVSEDDGGPVDVFDVGRLEALHARLICGVEEMTVEFVRAIHPDLQNVNHIPKVPFDLTDLKAKLASRATIASTRTDLAIDQPDLGLIIGGGLGGRVELGDIGVQLDETVQTCQRKESFQSVTVWESKTRRRLTESVERCRVLVLDAAELAAARARARIVKARRTFLNILERVIVKR